MNSQLYIIATPIGNLEDITYRAISTLQDVDLILCEDTRVTSVLLKKYEIDTPTKSYHQHSSQSVVHEILSLLDDGTRIALVTDAGTPGISDPGNKLISDIVEAVEDVEIIPIPGPSAVVAALSISGFPTDKFMFMGFPPHKKGRNKYFNKVADAEYTVAFYESTHRIQKTLNELSEIVGSETRICVCRELTKKFETVYRGTIGEIAESSFTTKGEFVVVVSK